MEIACALYAECIAEDLGYAPAWARIARCYRCRKYGRNSEQNLQGEQAFVRALELNLTSRWPTTSMPTSKPSVAVPTTPCSAARPRPYRSNDPELFAGLVYVCRYCGLQRVRCSA